MPKYTTRSKTRPQHRKTNATTTPYRHRPTAEYRSQGNYEKPHQSYHQFKIGDGVQVLHKYIDPKTDTDHWGITGTVERITSHYCYITTEVFRDNEIHEGPTYKKHRKYLHPIVLPPFHTRLAHHRDHVRFVADLQQKIAEKNSSTQSI